MAIENVTVKDASGNAQPISADKIGSDYVQVVKLGVGGDGAFALVDNANPIPTSTINGATEAAQTTAQATLTAIQSALTSPLAVTAAQATAASLKAQVQQIAATATDKSGTITTGGTAQAAIALNANRRAFYIQNLSAGDLWFSDTTTAVAASPSIKIPAGGLYESMPGNCPTAAISIIGATTGQAFAAREIT